MGRLGWSGDSGTAFASFVALGPLEGGRTWFSWSSWRGSKKKSMQRFAIGEEIDKRYVLKREIARGGGGVVFEAEQRFTTRRVALKLLAGDTGANSLSGLRLLREARALTVARHPNIVEVLDAGHCDDGSPYLAMELLEGRSLDGILASRGKLEPVDAAWVVSQVAAGIAKMHRHGLVHRDIKPSNVFVRYTQEGEESISLLDFGASTHEALPTQERITSENSLIGTPEYMSPEQLLGEIQPDPRMDVYGLGVLLYECLLGGVPYNGTYGEILLQVHSARPTALHSEFEKLPSAFRSIINQAMAVSLEQRLRSAAHLGAELDLVLSGMNVPPGSLLGLTEIGGMGPTHGRRRHTRAPYTTSVAMHTANGQRFEGRSQDLSTGGVLVLADAPFNSEKITKVELALPSNGSPVILPAVGRWSRAARQGLIVGVEFTELPEELSENIRKYVAEMVDRARRDELSPVSHMSATTTLTG